MRHAPVEYGGVVASAEHAIWQACHGSPHHAAVVCARHSSRDQVSVTQFWVNPISSFGSRSGLKGDARCLGCVSSVHTVHYARAEGLQERESLK